MVPVACGTPSTSWCGGIRSRQISRLLPLLIRRSSSRPSSPAGRSVPGRYTGPGSMSRVSRSVSGIRSATASASRVSIVGFPLRSRAGTRLPCSILRVGPARRWPSPAAPAADGSARPAASIR